MSNPIDVETIRALDSGIADQLEQIVYAAPALCDALERERKVSAAWKALAVARAEVAFSKAGSRDGRTPSAEARASAVAARAALVALGVDPEAP